jgi:predicted RNA polymerase sigma factor
MASPSYDQLLSLAPSPVVALNRAVAEVEGPDPALDILSGLDLGQYHLFHAIRADLLRRLDRNHEAAAAYGAAILVGVWCRMMVVLGSRLGHWCAHWSRC